MCCQMTLILSAPSLSVQKTVTVTLIGSVVGTTVEAWSARQHVSKFKHYTNYDERYWARLTRSVNERFPLRRDMHLLVLIKEL